MDPVTGAALVAGGSTLATNLWNSRLTKKSRKFALEQWQRENQYNHPTQQMQRLREAGLNPKLVYGNASGGTAGNAGSLPAVEQQKEMKNPLQSAGAAVQIQLAEAQKANIEADTVLKENQANQSIEQTINIRAQAELSRQKVYELEEDLAVKNMTIQDLEAKIESEFMSVRESMKYQEIKGQKARADILHFEAIAKKRLNEWLTANQLNKWAPMVTNLLGILLRSKLQ